MSAAANLREGFEGMVIAMKAIGLDVGAYRLSLYSLFSTVVVAILLYLAVKIVLRATKWLLRRNTHIDQTQRLLTEKLIAIALFVFAMLFGVIIGTYSTLYVAKNIVLVLGLDRSDKPKTGKPADHEFANVDA